MSRTDAQIDEYIDKAVAKASLEFRADMRLLLDEFDDRHKLAYEAIDFIKEQVRVIPAIKQDIAEMKSDMMTIKHVIRTQNQTW